MCFRLINTFVVFSVPLKRYPRAREISGNCVANWITNLEGLLYKEKQGLFKKTGA